MRRPTMVAAVAVCVPHSVGETSAERAAVEDQSEVGERDLREVVEMVVTRWS